MSGTENNPTPDETAAYIEDRMRQMVLDTITVLTERPDNPLPKPTTEFDFDWGYLTLTVSDQAALAAWRRQLLGPDLGDTYTVTSWCGWWTTVRVAQWPAPVQAERSGWDPYALPAIVPPPADCPDAERWETNEKRSEVVAALRQMATFLEDNPQLPVPRGVHMQHSILSGTRSEQIATVQAAAEHMGVDAKVTDKQASVSRHFGGEYSDYTYAVYARLPEPTTAEVVSAALEA